MSRMPLPPADQQSAPIREFMTRRGDLNVFRLLAHAPAVFVGWAQMVDEILDSPTFAPRMRELIILRVARHAAHRPGPLGGPDRTTDQRDHRRRRSR